MVSIIVVGTVLVLSGGGDETAAPAPTTTATTTTPPSTTSTTTTSTTTSTSMTAPATTTTPRTTRPRTAPPVKVPGIVVAVANPSGGSGEVGVRWDAVRGATGYRVYRIDSATGQARRVADFNITTGRATAAPEVSTVWSAEHSYIPNRGPLTRTDRSTWFEYIDVGGGRRCYRVLAYNAAGAGPLSAITCASPPGDSG